MKAFIATVPFTIIEAVHFVVENNIEDADLYFVNVFSNAKDIYHNIKKTDIFKNVYFIDDVLLTYPITIKKCIKTLQNGREFLKSTQGRKYDEVYYNNSGWLINSIFYTAFYKENKNIKNIFLEHGYYTYTNDYAAKPWYMKWLIKMVGLKCMDGSMLEELHMFHPEIMKMPHTGKLIKMKPLNKKNKRLVDSLNIIFDYDAKADEFRDKDIIIMEQGPQKYEFDKDAFWDKVIHILDKEKSIIKAHPRQKNSSLSNKGIAVCRNHTLPWEIELLNNDMTHKIKITIFSGACVSPKLIFDEEPIVVLLYKLLPVPKSTWNEAMLDFSNQIGRLYTDQNKYFVPETFEELQSFICAEVER